MVDLKDRFNSDAIRVINGFYCIPSIMAVKSEWKKQLKDFMVKYKSDMPEFWSIDAELDLWQNFWLNSDGELTSTVEETMKNMPETMFTNIRTVLHLLAVLPVTTCSCERSISTLRRVKTYLRNTMIQVSIKYEF